MELKNLAGLLVDQSPDAIIFADRDGEIRYWNAACEVVFGFTAEAALGKSLDIIIPEKLRAAHWRGFNAAMQSGATQHAGAALPTKALRADGVSIYVEMSFAVICDAAGDVIGSSACARDITQRFLGQRAKRKRYQELEKRLAELEA